MSILEDLANVPGFRHRGRANVVYVDGHTGTEKMLSGSLDSNIPSLMVGKLRPEILKSTNN